MNTQIYSPGPWECRGYPTPLGVVFDISQSAPGDVDVAYTYSHSGNAQLIAAAPCLLEALQALVNHGTCSDAEDRAKARAAIAKATGSLN